ncbi:rhodanese-like domain-containing protein [Myxococcota bacterium]
MTEATERTGSWLGLRTALRDAIVITVATSVAALLINLVHPNAIPYLAEEAYDTLVPCPVSGGPVTKLTPHQVVAASETDTFFVDARSAEAFERFHHKEAVNVTYDYLDPTPPETLECLARNIAASGAKRVVVYGDGEEPDTGEQLGKEISGFGIKNVCYLVGGAPALESFSRGGAP